MKRGNRSVFVLAIWLVLSLVLPVVPAVALDTVFDAPGFDPWRGSYTSVLDEHVDPFTGGLTLRHIDMKLPGNGGLDLVVERTYNSKNSCKTWVTFIDTYCKTPHEDTWMGYGWTLHFGRLFIPDLGVSADNNFPFIEMQDGSTHTAYPTDSTIYPTKWKTKEYWKLDKKSETYVATLTNGTKIHFEWPGKFHRDIYDNHSAYYATKIQDANGNTIHLHYKPQTETSTAAEIDYIIDSLGRRIDFTTEVINGSAKLVSINGPGVSIRYEHDPVPRRGTRGTTLKRAMPPEGNPWQYTYDPMTTSLLTFTSPHGGTMEYDYGFSTMHKAGLPLDTWTVMHKEAKESPSGSAKTWTFDYNVDGKYTEITDPCGRTTRYGYYGYGNALASGDAWMYGLPKSEEIVGEELRTYQWRKSRSISPVTYSIAGALQDRDVHVPLLAKRSTERDGKKYATSYGDYDRFGNPGTISEQGDLSRQKSISYWYNQSRNIVRDKPSQEILSSTDLPGTFNSSYAYDDNGNLVSSVKYDIPTIYTYYPNGNMESKKDAKQHTIFYRWEQGVISEIKNEIYSTRRIINRNGTVASETNGRGHTTHYSHDGNLRLRVIDPPLGNPTYIDYPDDNSYKRERKGDYYTTSHFDGFGRPAGTSDARGVTTTIAYKDCMLEDYTSSSIGDTVYLDNFGRTREIRHKDERKISYTYDSSGAFGNVVARDESAYATHFDRKSFGDPNEALLFEVTDPAYPQGISYGYNAAGSLTGLERGGWKRSYAYDGRNFLTAEASPEKGNVLYARDEVGNLTQKRDGLGTVHYSYDALDRLTGIAHGTVSVSFGYDNCDNRRRMKTPDAEMSYRYDELNRLIEKRETILGLRYETAYTYDGNGNVKSIRYPSGRLVKYAYNSQNQVTSVAALPGGPILDSATYHDTGPSAGLLRRLEHPNGKRTELTYTPRNLIESILVAPFSLKYSYSYDARGNLAGIKNLSDRSKDQFFTYDALSRLVTFKGPWGRGSHSFDMLGNRKEERLHSKSTIYRYDTKNRLVRVDGAQHLSYAYNATGDPVSVKIDGKAHILRYDRLHNLLSYQFPDARPRQRHLYDGDGMRIATLSDSKRVFHYDKEGLLLSESDEDGAPLVDYIYLQGKLLARIVKDSPAAGEALDPPLDPALALDPEPDPDPVPAKPSGFESGALEETGGLEAAVLRRRVEFYHLDPAGTPLGVTDMAGKLVWRAEYRPYGIEHEEEGTVSNDQLLTGKRYDRETGLYYFGARYMAPGLGRFLSPDSLGPVDVKTGKVNQGLILDPQKLNPYAYCVNNPYKYVDRDGRMADVLIDLALLAADLNDIATEGWTLMNTLGLAGDALGAAIPLVTGVGRGIKTLGKGLEAAKNAPVIIGENMKRVNAYAGKVGGETIDSWLAGRKWTQQLNDEFISTMKAQGRQIQDIGPDFSRRLQNRIDPTQGRGSSLAYGSERRELLGYGNYERLFDRTGKYQGGVPGFDN